MKLHTTSDETRLIKAGWIRKRDGRWVSPYTGHAFSEEDAVRVELLRSKD